VSDAETYFKSGNAHYQKGEYDLAIADYTKAIELNPNNVGVYYNRGLAYAGKGDLDRAITDYTRCLN
jgi:tetratricopeptide (TPR) repeat protein